MTRLHQIYAGIVFIRRICLNSIIKLRRIFIGELRRLQLPFNISKKYFKLRLDIKFLIIVINKLRIRKFYLEKLSQNLPQKNI